MTDAERPRGGYSRRRVLAGVATSALALPLAGCSQRSGGDGTAGDGTTTRQSGEDAGSDGQDGGASDGGTDGTGSGGTLPSPVAGDPEADVTLAVFEDYACPHCATYNQEGFPTVAAEFIDPGTIRYEHHDLPLPVANPGSYEAANAARAVQDRAGDEAFYDYAHGLFENYGQIPGDGPALYESLASDMGLDGGAIRDAATNRAYRQTVQADRQAGIDLGVSSTPTFVLNGEIVAEGWANSVLDTLREKIDGATGATA